MTTTKRAPVFLPEDDPAFTRVGFWYNKDEGRELPMPVAHSWTFNIAPSQFVEILREAEKKSSAVMYKGYSHCRLCDLNRNGTKTFNRGKFAWPEGLGHYIERHSVAVPKEFYDFIVGN